MAPTEGRVTRPGRQWGCGRGTPPPSNLRVKVRMHTGNTGKLMLAGNTPAVMVISSTDDN